METQDTILTQLDNARIGKFHLILILLSGSCWGLAAYGVTIIGFLLPSLRDEWQVSASALGLVASMGMIGMLVGSIVGGTLSDHFGRRSTLSWTLLYLGIVFLVSSAAWDYTSLLVLRLLTGVGLGAIMPVSSTLISEYSPTKYRGAMSILLNACWGIGGTLTALVGYYLVLSHGWRPAMWIGGLALLLSPLVRLLLPESIRYLFRKGKADEAHKEISRVHLPPIPRSTLPVSNTQPQSIEGGKQSAGIWSAPYARVTIALWSLWFALNFLYQGAFIWLPTLLAEVKISEGHSFLLAILISLGQVPGTLIAAYLADRMSRRKLIIASLALLSAGAFLFGLSQQDAWVVGMGLLFMLFNGMSWSLAYPFSSELYPTRMRGSATGWASGFGRTGGVVAPIVVGWVIQSGGSLLSVFSILACAPFAVTLVLSSIKLETTGRRLEDISKVP